MLTCKLIRADLRNLILSISKYVDMFDFYINDNVVYQS